ncbi:MAG: DNRLRE domain-containing protein [Chloroflexota bacterium]
MNEVTQPTNHDSDSMEWDISGMLQDLGHEVATSLMIDNGEFTFSSREGTNPPQLTIEYLVEPNTIPSQTLLPTDDTYSREAKPTTAYGSRIVLNVMNASLDQNSYVKFNLNDLPATPVKATLRLYGVNAGPDGGGVYAVSPILANGTQWTETNLKWNNAPAIGGSPSAQLGAVTVGQWVEADVTDAALAAITGDNGRLSLGIHNNSGDMVTYSSKEGEHPPELVLDFGDGGTPPPPPPPEPETVTYAPTNDAFIMQSKPKNIFGGRSDLRVQNATKDIDSYIKFSLWDLEGTVEQATLRLYVTDPGPDGGSLYTVSPYYEGATDLWLETGLKWNNAPPISGQPLAALGKVVKNNWVEVDVTQAVIDGLVNDNGRVTFALHNKSKNLVKYSSKEGAHPPELVVVVGP